MKAWADIYLHVMGMTQDRPTNIYVAQLFETAIYCAPHTQKFVQILQESVWRCEADKITYARDANIVAECNTKIMINKELLAWIEEQE
jgi:hypothetical protein